MRRNRLRVSSDSLISCRTSRRPYRPWRSASGGFTLLELVLVLSLLGLLGFILVPRFSSLGDGGLSQQAEQMRRDLSRAQLLALGQSQQLRLEISSGGYRVVACTAPATCAAAALSEPQTGESFVVNLSGGVTLSGPAQLDFDSLGRPVAAGALMGASTAFTLARGTSSARVEVLPLTGYARVVY